MDTLKSQRPVLTTIKGYRRRRRLGPPIRHTLTIAAAVTVTFFACYGLIGIVATIAEWFAR